MPARSTRVPSRAELPYSLSSCTLSCALSLRLRYFTIWGCFVMAGWMLISEVAESRQLFQRGKDIYDQNQYLCICGLAAVIETIASVAVLLRVTLLNSHIYQ